MSNVNIININRRDDLCIARSWGLELPTNPLDTGESWITNEEFKLIKPNFLLAYCPEAVASTLLMAPYLKL